MRTMASLSYLACVLCNPDTLVAPGRLPSILSEFSSCDIVALPSTGYTRHNEACEHYNCEHFKLLDFGWSPSKCANESCGVVFGIGEKLAKCVRSHKVFSPGGQLQGRGGAIRCTSKELDFCVIVPYFPVSSVKNYKCTSDCIFRWIHHIISSLPCRCTPITLGDCDAHIEAMQRGLVVGAVQSDCGKTEYNGENLVGLATTHNLCLVNSFWPTGGTFCKHGRWTPTRIDWALIPQSALSGVQACAVWHKGGDRLQHSNSVQTQDWSSPFVLEIEGGKCNFQNRANTQLEW